MKVEERQRRLERKRKHREIREFLTVTIVSAAVSILTTLWLH